MRKKASDCKLQVEEERQANTPHLQDFPNMMTHTCYMNRISKIKLLYP